MTRERAVSRSFGPTRRDFLAAVGTAAIVVSGRDKLLFGTTETVKSTDPFARGWRMQSSEIASASGDVLSKSDANIAGWYKVDLPSTVLAGLVDNGEYPDILNADNLKKVPKARFKSSWWYRKEFASPVDGDGSQVWLYFKGINYRANVWLNGKKIGDAKDVVGAYRDIEINATDAIVAGTNVLAVEVFPPDTKNDLTITFVDWAPAAPDANMGLWQDVLLRTSKPIAIRYPHLVTDFDPANPSSVKLAIYADLVNPTDKPITGTLEAQVEQQKITQQVTLAPHETKTIVLPEMPIDKPRLWWPAQLGKPDMYDLQLTFSIDGSESDRATTPFGIRKVTSRLEKGSRLFSINGVDLLILGGGYAPDLLQRRSPRYRPGLQEDHIRYVRDMNLNTVRLEGKLEDDAFYDLCDRHGVLVMPGWCCCSPWEQWKKWKEEQQTVAMASMRYQIRRARTHPSMLVYLNGSDNHPTEEVEKQYLAIESELKWPCPTISSATAKKSAAAGPTGVKMEGPYKWEPPIYWLTDKKKGGAHGFNTEVGPGAVPPPLESLEQMLLKDHYWPIDAAWNFHCGVGDFGNLNDFTVALDARFGKSKDIADFSWKAQAQAYETIKAMYEGFRRNKFNTATGEIQWMLNNAWPSMIWHLYDYYFRPGGAYFATKLACEPLHILYSYDNGAIAVANDSLVAYSNLTASAEVYDIDSKRRHEQHGTCDSPANSSIVVFSLPTPSDVSTAYFLRLTLKDSAGKILSINSYFLSTKPDVLDPNPNNKDDWAFSPCSSYADYTQLEKMPKVELSLKDLAIEHQGDEDVASVNITNTSPAIAMMVRLKLTKGEAGDEILPIRWEDNYFMLLPNESRQVAARYLALDAIGIAPSVSVECFNNSRGEKRPSS